MSVGDTLKTHWKKFALLGAVLGIGICVTLGIVMSKDVETPDDAQISEGGVAGAQKGSGSNQNVPGAGAPINDQREDPFKNIRNHELMKPLLTKQNYESNVFESLKPGEAPTINKDEYIIFLLNQNAGGLMMKNCFEILDDEPRNKPVVVPNHQTVKFFEDAKRDLALPHRFVMGEELLGICDVLPDKTPCSYFTILTDPYERITSTYIQAITSGAISDAMPIAEYAMENSNYFLHQILETAESVTGDSYSEVDRIIKDNPDDALEVALIGVDAWFKIVCNGGDMGGCFEQLDVAYGLNTKECYIDLPALRPVPKGLSPEAVEAIEVQLGGVEYPGKSPLEQLKNKLLSDEHIAEVLHSDNALFERVYETAKNGKMAAESIIRKR